MGPGFERIAERFCRAAVAIKDSWPRPPRSIAQLVRRRGDGWTDELAAAVRAIDSCIYEYLERRAAQRFRGRRPRQAARRRQPRARRRVRRSLVARPAALRVLRRPRDVGDVAVVDPLSARRAPRRTREAARRGRPRARATRRRPAPISTLSTYTEQVINEALRLYSPIHSISRVARRPTTCSAAITSRPAPRCTCRCTPRIDCRRFGRTRTASIPTVSRRTRSSGGRVSRSFRSRPAIATASAASTALVELKLAVAMIAQRYELTLAPGHRVEGAAGTTMHPRYGMNMHIRAI